MNREDKKAGFTIVELLIVIVVIGILAAITVIAYNGIQVRAMVSKHEAHANSITKGVKMRYAESDSLLYASAAPSTKDVMQFYNIENLQNDTIICAFTSTYDIIAASANHCSGRDDSQSVRVDSKILFTYQEYSDFGNPVHGSSLSTTYWNGLKKLYITNHLSYDNRTGVIDDWTSENPDCSITPDHSGCQIPQ